MGVSTAHSTPLRSMVTKKQPASSFNAAEKIENFSILVTLATLLPSI
jgi:hypothetical protein